LCGGAREAAAGPTSAAPTPKGAEHAARPKPAAAWHQGQHQQQTWQQQAHQQPTQARKAPSQYGVDRPAAKGAQTLSSSLQVLSNEDPDCLFIVRRINKLGFKASRILKQSFSAYGQVVRVLVAHSTVRQQDERSLQAVRRRPSSLGFVQMASAEAARQVLAQGCEQEVNGSLILVQKFEHKVVDAEKEKDDDECNDEVVTPGSGCEWQRWVSSSSGASCATTASAGSTISLASSAPGDPWL